MKKKILAGLIGSMLVASVGFAAPLTDYEVGKTAIDLTWRNTEISDKDGSMDKKYNMDWGITTGLGNNFAFQYRQFNPKSADTNINGDQVNSKIKTQEFNVLYKLNSNVSAYAGVMKAKGEYNDITNPADSGSTKNNSKWQVGLVGSTKIADKTTAYGSLAAGKDLTSYEVGVSYELASNLDFNVDYRSLKVNKLDGDKVDAKAKGLGFGVTYKF